MNQRLPGEALVEARLGEVRGRDGGPVPPPPSQCCPHPVSYLNKGRNQYGSWKRCNLCKTKLSYQEYGPSNPPPQTRRGGKKKNVTQETYVSTGPPITMGPLEAQGSSVSTLGPTMLDIQNVLTEQANHMAQSTASSMSQAMGPVMEAIHQMSNSQQALQQMVMNQQQLLNHLMTAPQSGRVPEAIPISSDQEEEMEEFEEGWVQPHP